MGSSEEYQAILPAGVPPSTSSPDQRPTTPFHRLFAATTPPHDSPGREAFPKALLSWSPAHDAFTPMSRFAAFRSPSLTSSSRHSLAQSFGAFACSPALGPDWSYLSSPQVRLTAKDYYTLNYHGPLQPVPSPAYNSYTDFSNTSTPARTPVRNACVSRQSSNVSQVHGSPIQNGSEGNGIAHLKCPPNGQFSNIDGQRYKNPSKGSDGNIGAVHLKSSVNKDLLGMEASHDDSEDSTFPGKVANQAISLQFYLNSHANEQDKPLENGLTVSPKEYMTDSPYIEKIEDKDQKKAKGQDTVGYLSLLKYADIWDKLLMVLGTLGALVNGATLPLFCLLFGQMVERLGTNRGIKSLHEVCVYMTMLAVASLIGSYAEVAAWALAAERQALRIRSMYLRGVLRQDIAFFDLNVETGGLLDRISADVDCIQDTIGHKTASFLHYLAVFVLGYIVGMIKGWQIALVVLFVSMSMVVIGMLQHGVQAKLAAKEAEASEDASNLAHQTLGSIRTVYSHVAEDHMYSRYSNLLEKPIHIGTKLGFVKGSSVGLFYFISFGIWATILWYGAILIAQNKLNPGNAVSCFFATVISGRCLGLALQYLSSFTEGTVAAQRIFQMIDRIPPIDSFNPEGLVLNNLKGKLEFRNVSFAYPTRVESAALRKFSLTVSEGNAVALVGPSGSGKSTVFSLVQRFYDPDKGAIYLDDVNLQQLQLGWLRRNIAMVGQEPLLFATSIRDNILFGRSDANVQDVEEAAKVANAHAFITAMPQGYDTQVGELGVQLSGGQKQRIAIARAVLKNPTILLLDEATSALDNQSELIIQQALDELMHHRTTIIIAHRLSTIRHVPLIAIIQDGKVVQKGSHENLLSNPSGLYGSLISAAAMNSDQHNRRSPTPAATPNSTLSSPRSAALSHSPYYSAQTTPASVQAMEIFPENLAPQSHRQPTNDERYFGQKNIPLSRIISVSKPYLPVLVLGLVAAVLAGIALPGYAYVIAVIIKHYYDADTEKMKRITDKSSLQIVMIGVACFLAMTLQHGFCNWAGIKLTTTLRERSFAAALQKEVGWFDKRENMSGSLAARISVESSRVRGLFGDRYSVLSMGAASLAAALLICFTVNWKMTLLATALTPFFLSSNYMEALLINVGGGAREVKTSAKSTNIASEAVANIRTVAAFNAEDKVVEWFVASLSDSVKQSIRRTQLAGAALGIAEALTYASYAVLLYYGSVLVQHKETNFDHVLKVFLVLVLSCFSLGSLARLLPDHSKASAAARAVFEIMDDDQPHIKEKGAHALETVNGEIQFHRVNFAYPARPEVQILREFDLKVKAGTMVALVGGSGSGKSTVISLVERFYEPTSGQILLDGIDIRELHLKWLRSQIALVSQEPVLFACSIMENIAYGNENATMAEIEEASQAADAHEFISGLQDGYATQVGERGVRMSGGQKQRIAIARAVLKRAKIWLLDEPTSALDVQSERNVQEALDKLTLEQRTTIVVAHRLSTIRNADRIAVIEAGRVVELGSHEKLVKKSDGIYSGMVMAQLQSPQH